MRERPRREQSWRDADLCRECGGWQETLMFWLDNAFGLDDHRFEIVEMHPCPYCTHDERDSS